MQHIENLNKLFGKDLVSNPVIDSFEAGHLNLTSGHLVACDPLITNDMPSFTTIFPKGSFPIVIHKEKESNCIAYVEITFKKETVHHWQLATLEGQNIEELNEGEVFGYPVQSGMGCLMDEGCQKSLNHLEHTLFERKGEDFMGIYEEFFHGHFFDEKGAIDQFALLKPDEKQEHNIFAFEAGYGEGFYASYIGFDAENNPIKIITEFIEISE